MEDRSWSRAVCPWIVEQMVWLGLSRQWTFLSSHGMEPGVPKYLWVWQSQRARSEYLEQRSWYNPPLHGQAPLQCAHGRVTSNHDLCSDPSPDRKPCPRSPAIVAGQKTSFHKPCLGGICVSYLSQSMNPGSFMLQNWYGVLGCG